MSQRAFDRARARSADHAHLPAARQIATELRLPWREVLVVALAPESGQGGMLVARTREQMPNGWLTLARVRYALRLIAGRLGVDTLPKSDYDAERAVLHAADARDWMHGGRLRLPSARSCSQAAGDWNAALRAAGLKPYVPPPFTIPQVIVSRVEVMDRFYDYYGEQPSHGALKDFARGNKIPMSGEGGRLYSEVIAEWRQSRLDRGLGEPRIVEHRGSRNPNDYSENVGAATPGESLYQGKWKNEGACVKWLVRYLASLPDGKASTQRGYAAWARQHPGAPGLSSFGQHGGWEAVRSKALERAKTAKP